MTSVVTSLTVSRVHAANMQVALKKARTLDELRQIAEKHSPYLLGKDVDAMRKAWVRRRAELSG